jgi:uncharacterized protein YecE (DUF72 family)
LPQSHWLEYYCARYSTVEINNSFYMQPSEKSWDRWRLAAPEGFRYAVKAHRYVTHLKRLADCADSLDRVVESSRRLGPHLGPLLFQLPPSFKRTPEHSARLESFLRLLPRDVSCAFEFRDKSWFADDTFEQLRCSGAAFCSFDSPKLKSPLIATAPFAYMRFHGSEAMYGGDYSTRQLEKSAKRLNELAAGVDDIYVYFNNDLFGHAVRNAIALSDMVGNRVVRLEQSTPIAMSKGAA